MQTTMKTYEYRNDIDAIKQVLKVEGVRGIYKAYGATVFSFGPFSAFYFLFYENLKGLMVKNDVNTYLKTVERKEEITISFTQSMLCSMVAGALAAVITNPLDLAKLRMQISRAGV